MIKIPLFIFDSPYRPITNTAGFTAYTENLFDDEEQLELVEFVEQMNKKGAKTLVNIYGKGVISHGTCF